jgi:hypothetical protein
MAIPSRGIGWGTEENLLWQISKQIEGLTCVAAGGCGSLTTTTTTTLPVYKVFTALLSQGGTSNPDAINNDSLVIGTTYEILGTDGDTVDFTNVGAPNNLAGTSFIATGTTPTSWGQTNNGVLGFNTGAPIAIILENTIGDVWFVYDDVGKYSLSSTSLFTPFKTAVFGQSFYSYGGDFIVNLNTYWENNNDNVIRFTTSYDDGSSLVIANGLINGTTIEIRVYN